MLKLITEDQDEKIEQPAFDSDPVDATLSNNACEEIVMAAVQSSWGLISEINSISATIDYNYTKENKEEIKAILENITDELTVSIGMLYKISDMMNAKTEKLLDAGMEKAEEIADKE